MFAPRVRIQSAFHLGPFSMDALRASTKSLTVWGAAAGIGALYFVEKVPFVRQDLLSKIPVAGQIWATPEVEE
ncbi:hypothetical protein H4R33_000320 [Dimargaris cristalligena]|uniref:Ubiquinol-cytochrome-c reductase complex subunit-domain-containing protein n=1 Tax=Dimargaris cristalligena TaxID=215637 RepID=A0A4P9ZT52_9FUNG|nr:hypothetical protein H4R33_000320 [Dimargaris cristalligena]RKP35690.1 hypothetical protein BJ085DRAFT_40388 [Dimargaris cristalligena]|eukprot:RKP35690.1 hypothetical protein BJ085DRAFT_40388 [Dimargaris cristalligena]